MSDPTRDLLEQRIELLNFEVSDNQVDLLYRYIKLLAKWNKTYNLTAVRDEREMVTLHLIDSLVISPYIFGAKVLDVGSGGGLPGVPMAIMHPEQRWTLVDTAGKKARFLNQVKIELGLENLEAIHSRVEQLEGQYDAITSRAFSTIALMHNLTSHLLDPNGNYFAMKGKYPEDEILEVDKQLKVVENRVLEVPGLDAERHLIILKPVGAQ